MKRLTPYIIFVLCLGGLVAYIYKDKIFPSGSGGGAPGSGQYAQAGGGSQRGGNGSGRRRDQPVSVTVEKVRTANVPVYLNGVGTVSAFNTATVRTQVSGRLISVPYTEGQDVKIGDVVAQIDPVLYKAAYDQAVAQKGKDEAILANARLDLIRYTNLVKTNAATQQQADTALWAVKQDEAQVALDQAQIDNAKANLDYATIKAPLNGRTGIRQVDTGNLVTSTDATGIVIITQLQPISVIFTLPENTVSDVLDASIKGPVELQAVSGGKVIGKGTLLVIDNQIDQTTGTYKIKGTFPNEQNRLWPGQFVNVKLKLKILPDAMVVPSAAVQQGANGSYVYLVTPESTAKVAYVNVIQEGERQTVIGSGVAPDDVIVTAGFASLQEGAKISAGTTDKVAENDQAPASDSGLSAPQGLSSPPKDSTSVNVSASAGGGGQGQHRHRRRQSAQEPGGTAAAQAEQGSTKQ